MPVVVALHARAHWEDEAAMHPTDLVVDGNLGIQQQPPSDSISFPLVLIQLCLHPNRFRTLSRERSRALHQLQHDMQELDPNPSKVQGLG